MQRLLQWFEDRTGYRHALDDALYERIPSGSRWRYVFGSTLVFAFVTQVITGLFLWMAYSPSSQTAWESVYYIQYEMQGGWLLRGVHHFMAQAMVVLLALHLLQVIIDGAYRAPREVNFWLGLVLMQIVLGLSLTGYLLPWDQKGYWATSVATNLATLVPFFGKHIQQLVVGGPQYGHHTLTRFFALHAGVLPVILTLTLVLHLALFRKHGVNAVMTRGRANAYFWPDQVLKDAVACLGVLLIVFLLAIHFDFGAVASGQFSPDKHGAELGAPADASEQYSAARPEWYFLFLFQLLKYFPGHLEIVGAIILPGLVMFMLFIMPFTAKIQSGKTPIGHYFNVAFILLVLVGAGVLTALAMHDDYYSRFHAFDKEQYKDDAEKQADYRRPFKASDDYLQAVKEAHASKERIVELIQHREEPDGPQNLIPRNGAIELLRSDPGTQGPVLFERSCLGCHAHTQLDKELAAADPKYLANRKISAPNLDGFGSREWVGGLLDPTQIRSINYFGNTAHRCGRMAEWIDEYVPWTEATPADLKDDDKTDRLVRRLRLNDVEGAAAKLRELAAKVNETNERVAEAFGEGNLAAAPASDHPGCEDDEQPEEGAIVFAYLQSQLDDIAVALSAQAQLPAQHAADQEAERDGSIARGIEIINNTCANGCHRFGDAGQLGLAPDLTGYGSWEWMMGMVSDPTHRRFYGRENDRMQSYGQSIENPQDNQLSAQQISMIVDWLRDDFVGASDDYVSRPHTPQQALRAWELARLTESPEPKIVGAPGQSPPSQLARAEKLFRQNCAACHSHADEHGVGIVAKKPSAPNLYGFASRAWIDGLLNPEKIGTAQYFGNTRHAGGQMAEFVEGLDREDEELPKLVAALSAEANLPGQAKLDEKDDLDEETRIELFEAFACSDCHSFHGAGAEDAPDLTGYGSMNWVTKFIANPDSERFYGRTSNDRMPQFAGHAGAAAPLLTDEEIKLLARYLRGENLSKQ